MFFGSRYVTLSCGHVNLAWFVHISLSFSYPLWNFKRETCYIFAVFKIPKSCSRFFCQFLKLVQFFFASVPETCSCFKCQQPKRENNKKTSFLHCVLLPLSFRCLSGPFFPSTRRNFDLPSVCWQQCVPFNARNRKQKSYHICHFFAFTSFTLIWVRSTQLPNTRMNNVFWRIWMWETGERSDGCCWLFLR